MRMIYDISFKRLPSESSMDAVLERPYVEEVEDYSRYKRLKKDVKDQQENAAKKVAEARPGVVVSGSDGTVDVHSLYPDKRDTVWDVYKNHSDESQKGSIVVRNTSRKTNRR